MNLTKTEESRIGTSWLPYYGTRRAKNITLKILTKIEVYLFGAIEVCETLAKKMKQFHTTTSAMRTNLKTSNY